MKNVSAEMRGPVDLPAGQPWYLVLGEVAVLLYAFRTSSPSGIMFLSALALLTLVIVWAVSRDAFSTISRLFVAALAVRVAVTLWAEYYLGGLPVEKLVFPDSRGYDFSSQFISRLWKQGEPADIKFFAMGMATGYYYLVSAIYFLFGHSPLLAKLFNCFLGALVVVYVYLAGKEVFSARAATWGAWIACFSPALVWWSSCLLKDTLVSFLLIASFYHLVRARNCPLHLAVCGLTSFMLFFTRFYLFGVFWILGGFWFLFSNLRGARRKYMLLGVVMIVLGFGQPLLTVLGEGRILRLPEFLQVMGTGAALDRSSYVSRFTFDSWSRVLTFLPVGVARFLLGPVPWKLEGPYRVLLPSILLRYALLPFFLIALVKSLRRFTSPRWLIGAIIVSLILIYSVVFKGSAGRRYAQMLGFIFLLASEEAGLLGLRDKRVLAIYLAVVLGGAAFLVTVEHLVILLGVTALSAAVLAYIRGARFAAGS